MSTHREICLDGNRRQAFLECRGHQFTVGPGGEDPLFYSPFLGSHTLAKDLTLCFYLSLLSLPDSKTIWQHLRLELPAHALGVRSEGIVVSQPFPSVAPHPSSISWEWAVRHPAWKCKRPEAAKKKKKLKLIFTSFNFKNYSRHKRN